LLLDAWRRGELSRAIRPQPGPREARAAPERHGRWSRLSEQDERRAGQSDALRRSKFPRFYMSGNIDHDARQLREAFKPHLKEFRPREGERREVYKGRIEGVVNTVLNEVC
jgi:hypothetical protein